MYTKASSSRKTKLLAVLDLRPSAERSETIVLGRMFFCITVFEIMARLKLRTDI